MSSNQIEWEIIEHVILNIDFRDAHTWDDHNFVTWDNEGVDVIYFLCQEKGEYHINIYWLQEDLYKTSHWPHS